METYKGRSIFGGIGSGLIRFYKKESQQVKRRKVLDVELEIERFQMAKEKAINELDVLYEEAVLKVGEINAAVFETHSMLLEDDDYLDSILNMIRMQEINAEYAVATTGDNFAAMFESMEEEYFQTKAVDMKDISERVIRILEGNEKEAVLIDEPAIIIADDLSPSETVGLEKEKVLAFVTRYGSVSSHTAILARSMNIPAITGIPVEEAWDGKQGVVDGFSGEFYVNPDEEIRTYAKEKQMEIQRKNILLEQLKGKDNITLGGKKIHVYANIGNACDVVDVLTNDSGGIGLFRSEFLYLDRANFPTEEEQFVIYKQVAENMAGKKVIVRTLDLGADKQVGYFPMKAEENPAMGYRGIRICLDRIDIFKTQLRAIFRASVYGTMGIMYPMITSLEEIQEIKQIVMEVKQELKEQQIQVQEVEQGIMIETPAAALISDELAKEVDFFSIGTNDLTQYTLALDRQNTNLDKYYQPYHKGILRLIQMTIENGHKEGCWVGICGELAGDLEMTETFLKMNVDELSVSPSMVLPLREKIRNLK